MADADAEAAGSKVRVDVMAGDEVELTVTVFDLVNADDAVGLVVAVLDVVKEEDLVRVIVRDGDTDTCEFAGDAAISKQHINTNM